MAIATSADDGLMKIAIDRPEARNAMDSTAYRDLHEAFLEFDRDDRHHVALLTTSGDHFTIGGDMSSYVAMSLEEWKSGPPRYSIDLNETMWSCRKPIVIAVRGYCVGWGMVALASADLRLASEGARLGYSGALRFFGGAGSGGFIERMLLQIPYVHALDLLFTGRLVDAEEAASMGLVNRVTSEDSLDAEAMSVVEHLLAMPPRVLRAIKSAARRLQRPLVDLSAEATDREGRLYFHTADFAEGLRSWEEKRDPVWTGR